MTATIVDPKPWITLNAHDCRVLLPDRFAIRVLGPGEREVNGLAIKVVGHRLIAQITNPVLAGEPVRIDAVNSFLLGEVLGCWREGGSMFAAIEIQQALTHLSELATWMDEPDPVEIGLSA